MQKIGKRIKLINKMCESRSTSYGDVENLHDLEPINSIYCNISIK